jgi:biotin operon repressor
MKNPIFSFVGGWQSPVPNSIIRNDKLSDRARMLWIFIRSYASPSSPAPFPKNSTICKNLGWSRETLWKYMEELEQENYMMVKRVEFTPNHYYLFDTPKSNFTESENFALGKTPTEKKSDPKSTHSEEDKPLFGTKGKRFPLASLCDAPESLPVQQHAARNGSSGCQPTSSALAPAGAGGDDEENFELDDRGKALQKLWDEYFFVAFRRKPKHTEDDRIALQQLSQEAPVREIMGFILSAWSFKRKESGFDPYFYCTRYSSRPRDICMIVCKDGINNLEKMRAEMSWRGTKSQIEFGYQWFEKLKANRAAPVVKT